MSRGSRVSVMSRRRRFSVLTVLSLVGSERKSEPSVARDPIQHSIFFSARCRSTKRLCCYRGPCATPSHAQRDTCACTPAARSCCRAIFPAAPLRTALHPSSYPQLTPKPNNGCCTQAATWSHRLQPHTAHGTLPPHGVTTASGVNDPIEGAPKVTKAPNHTKSAQPRQKCPTTPITPTPRSHRAETMHNRITHTAAYAHAGTPRTIPRHASATRATRGQPHKLQRPRREDPIAIRAPSPDTPSNAPAETARWSTNTTSDTRLHHDPPTHKPKEEADAAEQNRRENSQRR